MTPTPNSSLPAVPRPKLRAGIEYAIKLGVVAFIYYGLARFGLGLASINPSATPIWPATGFALAALLMRGYRLWPAIFAAAFLVNQETAGTASTSLAIAAGNTLEGLLGAVLVRRWSTGPATFETPTGIAKFALIVATVATVVSATIGVGSLTLAGFSSADRFGAIWLTWWFGDLASALVVTPVLVLWARADPALLRGDKTAESVAIFALAIGVGVLAFSPLLVQTPIRDPAGFLAILPLIWAALRRGPRDTATAAFIMCCFAVWGTVAQGGPFVGANLNESFLLLLMFMISITMPSLVLSADVAVRKQAEQRLRRREQELREELSQDINLRLEVQKALLESEQQFRLLVQSVSDYAIVMLDAKGVVANWNSGAERIKGYAAEEVVGRHFGCFYTEEDRRQGLPERALANAADTGKHEAEGWRVRRDGSPFWASVVMDAIRDENGRLIGFAKITRDITERRRAQEALDEAREQLAQAQRLEALGQLTGGIAHDFNNLLMIVSGYAQSLRLRLKDAKEIKALDAIGAAAARGESLTRQLLSFSRTQKLAPEVVDLRERLEAVHGMLGGSLRGDIKIVCDAAPDLWRTEVDVAELELALVNVALNARDAMPSGGTITIAARNMSLGRGSQSGAAADIAGDFVALRISDTGAGIPADVLPRIFDPFFTTKSIGKGTGLGLSQVYGFARQSGGAVVAESKEGAGTAVTIYLPRCGAPVSKAAAKAAAPRRKAAGTVLMVEDNPEVAGATGSLLEQLGYRVKHADGGAAALARLADGGPVDVVLSDIIMPGMNGIALAREIGSRHPELPVVLTTGYSDVAPDPDRDHTVLRKPLDIATLDDALRKAMAKAPRPRKASRRHSA